MSREKSCLPRSRRSPRSCAFAICSSRLSCRNSCCSVSRFSSALLLGLLLAHVHDAGHEWVQGADVIEITFGRERVLELIVGIQAFRAKALVVAGHRMRRLIVIDPGDFRAWRDRDFLRSVRELGDIN